jgi:hypothetical protein
VNGAAGGIETAPATKSRPGWERRVECLLLDIALGSRDDTTGTYVQKPQKGTVCSRCHRRHCRCIYRRVPCLAVAAVAVSVALDRACACFVADASSALSVVAARETTMTMTIGVSRTLNVRIDCPIFATINSSFMKSYSLYPWNGQKYPENGLKFGQNYASEWPKVSARLAKSIFANGQKILRVGARCSR